MRRLRLGVVATVVLSLLLLVGLVGGLFATSAQAEEFFENPITVLTWVDFWVGLGIVSWVIGDLWEHVSPLNVAARALDRALARRGVQPLAYPQRLGQWPAVALLLVWSWMELIWSNAKEPRTLALLLIAYMIATLVGCALYGAETWLGNVELFSVFARTLSRFSPLELRPFVPEEWASTSPRGAHGPPAPLRRRACALTRRCRWAARRSCSRRLRPSSTTAGRRRIASARSSSGSGNAGRFSRRTSRCCRRFRCWLSSRIFVAAYLLVTRREAVMFAPTLIPIAAVYFTAHYFAYLLIAGQATLGVIIDPFGLSWNPLGWGEYALSKGVAPAGTVWAVQVILIVWGHVAAVFAAHRLALRDSTRGHALVAQAPLVGLMVLYTVAGLWVLAQQIKV